MSDTAAGASSGEAAGGSNQGTKTSGRKRIPTAAAVAASEQAQADTSTKTKMKTRKKSSGDTGVSRTNHGGVKIGGRAVTWVGGAGIAREVLDKMGIPQLRALFLKTFNHPTGSNNAEWLRKKLSQPADPQVGAARAAVPRARDCAAEIWSTGTTFKGFTKQERYRLQQMGGNCEAKVVQVLHENKEDESDKRRRKKSATIEPHKMQVVGGEKFEMPPPKRLRNSLMSDPMGMAPGVVDVSQPQMARPQQPVLTGYSDAEGYVLPTMEAAVNMMAKPWRSLSWGDAHLLQPGINVKVYRADERWHHGTVESVTYKLSPANNTQQLHITIYYWEHDQSEERPLSEFFRGEAQSLIQWQEPATHPMTMGAMYPPMQAATPADLITATPVSPVIAVEPSKKMNS